MLILYDQLSSNGNSILENSIWITLLFVLFVVLPELCKSKGFISIIPPLFTEQDISVSTS